MALTGISQTLDLGAPASQRPAQEDVRAALGQVMAAAVELQRLRFSVVAGANAATPIALAPIAAADTIVAALLIKDPATALTTASVVALTPSIPSAGNVQFVEATNTDAGDRVVVVWFDKA